VSNHWLLISAVAFIGAGTFTGGYFLGAYIARSAAVETLKKTVKEVAEPLKQDIMKLQFSMGRWKSRFDTCFNALQAIAFPPDSLRPILQTFKEQNTYRLQKALEALEILKKEVEDAAAKSAERSAEGEVSGPAEKEDPEGGSDGSSD